MAQRTLTLLSGATATGAGSTVEPETAARAFQASGLTSSGAGSATVLVQVSADGTNWMTLATITLTLTTSTSSDGLHSTTLWKYVRGNISAISGTGAAVTLICNCN